MVLATEKDEVQNVTSQYNCCLLGPQPHTEQLDLRRHAVSRCSIMMQAPPMYVWRKSRAAGARKRQRHLSSTACMQLAESCMASAVVGVHSGALASRRPMGC